MLHKHNYRDIQEGKIYYTAASFQSTVHPINQMRYGFSDCDSKQLCNLVKHYYTHVEGGE